MTPKYELSIVEYTPFTEEEMKDFNRNNRNIGTSPGSYGSNEYHTRRKLLAEVTAEEFEMIRDTILARIQFNSKPVFAKNNLGDVQGL